MKKKFLTIVCLFIVIVFCFGATTEPLGTKWIPISKVTSKWSLSNPYFILKSVNDSGQPVVWNPGTGNWIISGATYNTLDVRPANDPAGNGYIFTLPQDADMVKPGVDKRVALVLYDAADGAEANTDTAIWGSLITIRSTGSGNTVVLFSTVPIGM